MQNISEDTKARYIEVMGRELGAAFYRIVVDYCTLKRKWDYYVVLFGTNPQRVELLNKAAPELFSNVQDLLWIDIIQHICRITDRPKTLGRENLSLRQLQRISADAEFRTLLEPLLLEVEENASFCRDWRNRAISHLDLEFAINPRSKPLDHASRAKIREVLKSIEMVLDAICRVQMGSQMQFLDNGHSAVELLHIIDDGVRVEAERRARIKSRTYRPEDVGPPKRDWL